MGGERAGVGGREGEACGKQKVRQKVQGGAHRGALQEVDVVEQVGHERGGRHGGSNEAGVHHDVFATGWCGWGLYLAVQAGLKIAKFFYLVPGAMTGTVGKNGNSFIGEARTVKPTHRSAYDARRDLERVHRIP